VAHTKAVGAAAAAAAAAAAVAAAAAAAEAATAVAGDGYGEYGGDDIHEYLGEHANVLGLLDMNGMSRMNGGGLELDSGAFDDDDARILGGGDPAGAGDFDMQD
jgi:opacity protein-like surface antigen